MREITLPFFLRSKPNADGSHRFGWVDVDVEVDEVESSSVELAMSVVSETKFNDLRRQCFYALNGEIWTTLHPQWYSSLTGVRASGSFAINEAGVVSEHRFGELASQELQKATLDFSRRLHNQEGFQRARPRLESAGTLSSSERVDFGNLDAAKRFARSDLVMADGVLLRKSFAPSLVLVAKTGYPPGVSALLCHSRLSCGVHFAYPDAEFHGLMQECVQKFNLINSQSSSTDLDVMLSGAATRLGLQDEIAVMANTAFNGRVLAALDDEFEIRSQAIISMACVIADPHAVWRSAFKGKTSQVREMLEIVRKLPARCIGFENEVEAVAHILQQLPTSGYPKPFAWLLEKSLERYYDRPMNAISNKDTSLAKAGIMNAKGI